MHELVNTYQTHQHRSASSSIVLCRIDAKKQVIVCSMRYANNSCVVYEDRKLKWIFGKEGLSEVLMAIHTPLG